MATVNIKINGRDYQAESGMTILEACKAASIDIPTLCYMKKINAIGACRICLVEVKGARSLVAACVQPINEGMEIFTNTPAVQEARKINRELILSKSYVQNLFSQNMHIGLKEYIMKKKIYAARTDIKNGMTPIEACEKYAFGDYSGFYRLYKKTFLSSPRQ